MTKKASAGKGIKDAPLPKKPTPKKTSTPEKKATGKTPDAKELKKYNLLGPELIRQVKEKDRRSDFAERVEQVQEFEKNYPGHSKDYYGQLRLLTA